MKQGLNSTSAHHTDHKGKPQGDAAPSTSTRHITLDSVHVGAQVAIQRLTSQGATRQRLLDMGLTPGTMVTVLRAAPLNDPIEISVDHAFVSLRRTEAAEIEVCLA